MSMSDTKPDPYAGIDLPKPPRGYRLAKWGEEADNALWWVMSGGYWSSWGSTKYVNSYELSYREGSIFAVPKPRIRIELEQGEEVE